MRRRRRYGGLPLISAVAFGRKVGCGWTWIGSFWNHTKHGVIQCFCVYSILCIKLMCLNLSGFCK
jgi:hypothetical protein